MMLVHAVPYKDNTGTYLFAVRIFCLCPLGWSDFSQPPSWEILAGRRLWGRS
jgi:hypothetical protein